MVKKILFTFVILSLFPVSLRKMVYINASGPITISISSVTLPRVAFKESQREYTKYFDESFENSCDLNESLSHVRVAQRSVSSLFMRKINLEPLRFSPPAKVVSEESSAAVAAAGSAITSELSVNRAIAEIDSPQDWKEDLNPKEKIRIAEYEKRYGKVNFSAANVNSSVSEKARDLVANERHESAEEYQERAAASDPVDRSLKALSDLKTISGNLRLNSLQAMGDRHIEVRRFVDGVATSDMGEVDMVKGLYRIKTNELSGTLQAMLYDTDGKIIARAKQKIVPKMTNADLILEDEGTTVGTLMDFAKTEKIEAPLFSSVATKSVKSRVSLASLQIELQSDELGTFIEKDHHIKGDTILRAESEKHFPVLTVIRAGQKNSVSMFPASTVQALAEFVFSYTGDDLKAWNGSVVWGQVTLDGKPVAGVQVELENKSSEPPVYFKGWLPDFNLTTTSENGFFSFINLEPGVHSIVARMGEKIIGHYNVITEENNVSPAPMSLTIRKEKVPLRVYDAFSGEAKSAQVSLQSADQELEINGEADIYTSGKHTWSFAQVGVVTSEKSDYISSNYLYSESDEYIHLPLVHRSWIDQLIYKQKLEVDREKPIIIGFVTDENYSVYLSHEADYDYRQRIWFTARGDISDKPSAGGGFIFFNVPAGAQSVVMINEKTEEIISKVVPADPRTTTILSFEF